MVSEMKKKKQTNRMCFFSYASFTVRRKLWPFLYVSYMFIKSFISLSVINLYVKQRIPFIFIQPFLGIKYMSYAHA